MPSSCSSGKVLFPNEELAVNALLDVWSRMPFRPGDGPVTVYRCEDCGQYHFTSQGAVHPRLQELIDSGGLDRMREASRWEDKFRRN